MGTFQSKTYVRAAAISAMAFGIYTTGFAINGGHIPRLIIGGAVTALTSVWCWWLRQDLFFDDV